MELLPKIPMPIIQRQAWIALIICLVFSLRGQCLIAQEEALDRAITQALQGGCGLAHQANQPNRHKALSLEAEVVAFFRNNEYEEQVIKDYTLPGYRLRANFAYTPQSQHDIQLRVGFSNIYFWGSRLYPTGFAYTDLPYWSDEGYRYTRFRLLPFVQASIRPARHWQVTLGSLAQPEGFIDPLYNEELHLTADQPTGVQISYQSPRNLVDMWVNWQSFIYKRAGHPEAFTFGLNAERSLWQYAGKELKLSLQSITAHRGGVHNLVPDTVHTQSNFALGLRFQTGLGTKPLRTSSSLYALGYLQRGGHYPWARGWAVYGEQSFGYGACHLGLNLFYGRSYVAPYGNPFAQAINEDRQTYNPQAWSAYVHWYVAYRLLGGRLYDFGAKLGLWHHPHTEKPVSHYLALYLTLRPSLTL